MNPFYREYSDFLSELFDDKVQKLTVDAGFSCPNRDGKLSAGGCIYCNNNSFSPETGSRRKSIEQQLDDGKQFFAKKYSDMRYVAYFQSYTNTYGDVPQLMSLYRRALAVDDVVGLIIGTRPDCMPDELLAELAKLNADKPVIVEYGAESSHDRTLELINRCHSWADTVDAVMRTHAAGLNVGLHFILGLPGEDEQMMLQTVDRLSELPVQTVKFHQLQVIKSTKLARDYESGTIELKLFEVEEYIDLCVKIVKRLRRDIAIERFVSQSPDGLLIAPRWGLKNYQFQHLLNNRLANFESLLSDNQ